MSNQGLTYVRYPYGFRSAGRCRHCGCTDRRACRDGGVGCWWVDPQESLCSHCQRFPARRRFRRPRLGHTAALQIRAWLAAQRAHDYWLVRGEEY